MNRNRLLTIRQAAARAECPVSENTLRHMAREGACPGVRVGNRFYVDLPGLCRSVRQREQYSTRAGRCQA